MRTRARVLGLFGLLATALPAFAATGGQTFQQLVDGKIVPLVDSAVIPLLFVLAFLFFLVGILRYFFTGGAENKEAGRAFVMWSLVGMVVIFSVWGIIKIVLATLFGSSA